MNIVERLSQQSQKETVSNSFSDDYVVLGIHYPIDHNEDNVVELPNRSYSNVKILQQFFTRVEEIDYHPGFISDVASRLNFTYRTRFMPITRSPNGPSPLKISFLVGDNILNTLENAISNPNCFNTDIGWGCMIRTGQSLLGNAIQISLLGREYRINNETDEQERKIISWFMDDPNEPFSLHNFVKKGALLSSKQPGEWFGPAATSRSIQDLVYDFPDCGIGECFISVSSGDIFQDEIAGFFQKRGSDCRILLLLGVKLGINTVNEYYWEDAKELLNSKYSVGISGGRPSSSLYFFGYQGDELLYFDPHKPQPSMLESLLATCHSEKFEKMHLSDMDPSMLIGFLVNGVHEWESLEQEMKVSKIINILPKRDALGLGYDALSYDEDSLDPPDNEYVDLGPICIPTASNNICSHYSSIAD